jgi:hypothetical protein
VQDRTGRDQAKHISSPRRSTAPAPLRVVWARSVSGNRPASAAANAMSVYLGRWLALAHCAGDADIENVWRTLAAEFATERGGTGCDRTGERAVRYR